MQQINDNFGEIPAQGRYVKIYIPRGNERYGPIFSDTDDNIGIVFFEKRFNGLVIDIKKEDLKLQDNKLDFKFTVTDNPKNVELSDINSPEFLDLVNFSLNDLFNKVAAWEEEKDKT
jgi:hypothetical protein